MIRSLLMTLFILVSTLSAMAANPAGTWRGGWRSQTSGHHGPMRATVRPQSDGSYHARFTGRFALVIPFTYQVTLRPVASDGHGTTLVASKRLPLLGTYQMTANVSGNRFSARYQAAKDRGSFQMTAVP